jgi:hypothetical protein
MAFLGPAFICTLLLGSKKLMTFFGQGALLAAPDVAAPSSGVVALMDAFDVFVLAHVVLGGCVAAFVLYRRQLRVRHEATGDKGSTES